MTRVLFSTLYKSKSIIKSAMQVNPSEIVLFIDKKIKPEQKESLNFVEETFKDSGVKVKTITLELFNSVEIIKSIKNLVRKYNAEELYFDVTSSPKPQTFNILYYLMISKPSNLKDIFYYFYNSEENHFIKLPLFEVEKLSDKEVQLLTALNNDKKLLQKEISIKIDSTEGYTSKLIDKLIVTEYLIKDNKELSLTEKSKIYLEAISD